MFLRIYILKQVMLSVAFMYGKASVDCNSQGVHLASDLGSRYDADEKPAIAAASSHTD
jgi:hypothetical protein